MFTRNLTFFTISALFIALFWSTTQAQSTPNLSLIGQSGGSIKTVFAQGNYAYAGLGSRLAIFDVSDPANPQQVGQSELLPQVVNQVIASGNYAYVLAERAIYTFDVSNPTNVIPLGNYTTPEHTETIDFLGDYIYLIDKETGLYVIDVHNPASPVLAGQYDTVKMTYDPEDDYYMGDWAYDMRVVNGYAYVASSDSLQIIDVSNPSTPIKIGSYDEFLFYSPLEYVEVKGNYAYITHLETLDIIDVSNPATPSLVTSYEFDSDYIPALHLADNYIYVAYSTFNYENPNIDIIDISDPTNPNRVGQYNSDIYEIYDIYVTNGYVYIASEFLEIGNVSSSATPTLVGKNIPFANTFSEVMVANNQAYIIDDQYFQIFSTNDANNPNLIGKYNINNPRAVDIIGNYAYIVDYSDGLFILDISAPTNPVLVSNYTQLSRSQMIKVIGSYAYVAANGLQVIDISDPTNPNLVGSYNSSNGFNFDIVNNYAYFLNLYEEYVEIIDISDPSKPNEVAEYDLGTNEEVQDVVVNNNYVYILHNYDNYYFNDDWTTVTILDISIPDNPTEVGKYSTEAYATDMLVSNNYVYIALSQKGIQMLDITNPANPTLVSSYDTGSPYRFDGMDNRLYVIDNNNGWVVLEIEGATIVKPTAVPIPTNTPTPTSTPTNTPTPTSTPLPVMTTIPAQGGTLNSNNDTEQPNVTIQFANQTVMTETLVTYSYRLPETAPPLVPIDRSFELAALQQGSPLTMTNQTPMTIVVEHATATSWGAIPNTLHLYRLKNTEWVTDDITFIGRDNQVFTATSPHFTHYAVLGQTNWTYIPTITRHLQ